MAIQMIPMQCPNCGATFQADSSREVVFCQYCGTKIDRYDTNTYNVNINETRKVIDEADVIRAQTEHAVAMQKIEQENYRRKAFRKHLKIYLMIGLPLLLIPIIVPIFVKNPGHTLTTLYFASLLVGCIWSLCIMYENPSWRERYKK